jgi:hypothetical protein
MLRSAALLTVLAAAVTSAASASEIRGHYLEARTCQIYTGPCFANAEVGLAGKDAVMAWHVQQGSHEGVDLSGLSVVVALGAEHTLGFLGIEDGGNVKSVVYLDERASAKQQVALLSFARQHAGRAGDNVVRVTTAPISMSLSELELAGKLDVGDDVKLVTRKARPEDCICSNETAYYPPLANVKNFAAGVTTVGEFNGRGLGTRWSTPDARSAYMATFAY